MVAFVICLLVVGVAISRGLLTMAETAILVFDDAHDVTSCALDPALPASSPEPVEAGDEEKRPECTSATPSQVMSAATPEQARPRRSRHGLSYHCGFSFLGFLAICLAGYELSQPATNITDQFGLSDVLFGFIILAIATTLPEKFVAVMGSHGGRPGILVAACADSNIVLLAFCVGIIMVDTEGTLDGRSVTIPELVVL
jgi:hypothetical protein